MDKEEIYDTLNRAYFAEDCHERQLLENLPRLIAGARFFVDVGASLGQYTRVASRIMRGGKVLAIEPDPVRHEELARNAARWSSETGCRIDTVLAAASETSTGETSFFTTHSNVSGALFPRGDDWQEIRVPAVTLDEICGTALPDFVKADVEGTELRMLKGASRILAARRTVFLLELHPWADPVVHSGESVLDYMRGHGFHYAEFYDHALFMPFSRQYVREWAAAGWRKVRRRLQ